MTDARLSPPIYTKPASGKSPVERLVLGIFAPDFAIRRFLERRFARHARTDRFGITEALAFGGRVDLWQRYAAVVEATKALGDGARTVLEIGSGHKGVTQFLDPGRYQICMLDPFFLPAPEDTRVFSIVADGAVLPFRDGAFDIVIAVDALEHFPRRQRAAFAAETQRVAANSVIIHVPAVSADGRWDGMNLDRRFNVWHRRLSGMQDRNSVEHLQEGLPAVEELQAFYPGARIAGDQNGRVWLRCMLLTRIPFLGILTGFAYLLWGKRNAHTPPWHGCLLVSTKNSA
jgi:hypothetical protein